MIHYGLYPCPLGTLVIGCDCDRVVSIKLASGTDLPHCPSPVTELAALQLREYFDGNRKSFDFPIEINGTSFQQSVWNALLQIPYGETRTYGDIAAMIGNPKASRAVGMACNRNPLWIVVPCHRVVGKGGALTGFEGGLDTKKGLLELERPHQ